MIFLIGPRHSSGAHNFRAPLEWRGPMKVFFQGGGVGGFVDSWPETLVSSASNRSTLEWTLVDSRQGLTKSNFALPERRLVEAAELARVQRAQLAAQEVDRLEADAQVLGDRTLVEARGSAGQLDLAVQWLVG